MVEISWRLDKVVFCSSTERFTVGRQGARRKVVHSGQSFPIIVMCSIHGMAKPHEGQKEVFRCQAIVEVTRTHNTAWRRPTIVFCWEVGVLGPQGSCVSRETG